MPRALAVASIGVALALGAHCRPATGIRVRTYSEVPCASGGRVALVVAHDPSGLASGAVSALSTTCAAAAPPFAPENDVGSVFIAPSGSNDAPIAFALLQRLDKEPPESCLDPAQAKSCIVARRQLGFSPHDEIDLAVELRLSCLGVECPAGQTCRGGECVGARVPAGCSGCTESALGASSAPHCGDARGLEDGAPWPMAGYCSTRASRSSRNGPQTGSVRWTFATNGIASTSPAVAADGTVYVGANDHAIHAVDRDGHEKWNVVVGSNLNRTGFVVGPDGVVYFGSADTNMYAYSASGARLWAQPLNVDVANTVAVGGDGTLYVVGYPSPTSLIAVAASDGHVIWQKPNDFGSGGVAIGQDGTLYVGAATAQLYALAPSDGHLLWSGRTSQPPTTPAVADDGTVYVADGKQIYAFDGAGAQKWTVPIDGNVDGIGIAADGTVYAAVQSGKLLAVTPAGVVRWTFQNPAGFVKAPAVGADGAVYLGGVDGGVYAVAPDGSLLWKVQTGDAVDSQPAIGADGTLYIASNDRKLYAIGP
jgi:outer membrane protein assembly factor BamB